MQMDEGVLGLEEKNVLLRTAVDGQLYMNAGCSDDPGCLTDLCMVLKCCVHAG